MLPFENASGDPDSEYLSDGVTEELINRLSGLPGLRVVPRGIVFTYKARPVDLRTIGNELDTRALVTGRVTERDGSILVSAELTDLQGPAQLWGQQYNRPTADLFALQESIARDIANELQIKLTPEREQELGKRYTSNSRAYELYLRSVFYGRNSARGAVERGREYAKQAIAEDPTFALGYIALARTEVLVGFSAYEPPDEAYARAKAAAERALELDPALADGHVYLAFAAIFHEWDWAAAEREIDRARELDPEAPGVPMISAYWLAVQGRLEEGLVEARRYRELEPLSPSAAHCVAWLSFLNRDYETALAEWRRATELQSDYLWARRLPPLALVLQGRYPEALEAAERSDDSRSVLAFVLASSGDEAGARRALTNVTRPGDRALALAVLGERDAAFADLERAVDTHSSSIVWAKTYPVLDPLRDDPRFDGLLRKMGL